MKRSQESDRGWIDYGGLKSSNLAKPHPAAVFLTFGAHTQAAWKTDDTTTPGIGHHHPLRIHPLPREALPALQQRRCSIESIERAQPALRPTPCAFEITLRITSRPRRMRVEGRGKKIEALHHCRCLSAARGSPASGTTTTTLLLEEEGEGKEDPHRTRSLVHRTTTTVIGERCTMGID